MIDAAGIRGAGTSEGQRGQLFQRAQTNYQFRVGSANEAFGGLVATPLTAGGKGIWGQSPQRSEILQFFAKITLLYAYFSKN